MSEQKDTWNRLLQIEAPWMVQKLVADESSKRYDVWVSSGSSRKWFSFVRKQETEHYTWRHVNFGDWSVFLHVSIPDGTILKEYPWTGKFDLPFSHLLSNHVIQLLMMKLTLKQVSHLLNIPITELWSFRYAIDTGRLQVSELDTENIQEEEEKDLDIPDINHPVWNDLVEGKINIDVHALALKMMLSRLITQMQKITDAEVRQLKLHELYNYFIKNKKTLSHELAQLRQEAKNV